MTLKKSTLKKQRSPLKKLSAKTAKRKREYKKVCDEIDQAMLDEYGYIHCTSCGERNTGYNGMAHSHNLPKGGYPQFETEKWNISPRCMDCHRSLDNHVYEDIKYFKDLDKIMNYRQMMAPDLYNRTITGLKEVSCHNYDYLKFYK